MDSSGFEPEAPALQERCSTGLSYKPIDIVIICENKGEVIGIYFENKKLNFTLIII